LLILSLQQDILTELNLLPDRPGTPKDLTDRYRELLDKIMKMHLQDPNLVELLKAFVSTIINEKVSLVISRQLLADIANHILKLPNDVTKVLSHFILERIQQRVISFEEQVSTIRQHLASIYEAEFQWREAASVLVSFSF